MATMSGNLATGETTSGPRGNGARGRFGRTAKLAAGVATLGCAAALAFGGLQAAHAAPVPPTAAAVIRSGGYDVSAWPAHRDDARLDASDGAGAPDTAKTLPDLWDLTIRA